MIDLIKNSYGRGTAKWAVLAIKAFVKNCFLIGT